MLDIIDDTLTDEEMAHLEETFEHVKFRFMPKTNSYDHDSSRYTMFKEEDSLSNSQFVGCLVADDEILQEECTKALLPLYQQIDKYMESNNLQYVSTWRIKCNVTHPNPLYRDNNHDEPHCDSDPPTGETFPLTVLYYANDSDGDTYVHVEGENVRITPKRGRFVVFPSHTPHAANSPRKFQTRKVINSILYVRKK